MPARYAAKSLRLQGRKKGRDPQGPRPSDSPSPYRGGLVVVLVDVVVVVEVFLVLHAVAVVEAVAVLVLHAVLEPVVVGIGVELVDRAGVVVVGVDVVLYAVDVVVLALAELVLVLVVDERPDLAMARLRFWCPLKI